MVEKLSHFIACETLLTWELSFSLGLFDLQAKTSLVCTRNPSSAHLSIFPREEIERAWKNVLLNQFHDVLPGTSIGCVYEDVHRLYEESEAICNDVIRRSLKTLIGCSRKVSFADGVEDETYCSLKTVKVKYHRLLNERWEVG